MIMTARPARPYFSSGPCAKRPGWQIQNLQDAPVARSHRAAVAKTRLKLAIELTRELLQVPAGYRIGIVPGSDTGAVEMALWSLLGHRGVDVLAWESFGEGWVTDIVKQLKLNDVRILKAGYGEIVDLKTVDFENDVVFTWNGTTSGVRVPNGDWIAADRKGLTICDATSAAFAQRLDWPKLDVVTFSWQKVLGGEAGHGMLILSPRAVERLLSYTPRWPLPKIFRLTNGGKLIEGIFEGETIHAYRDACHDLCLRWLRQAGALLCAILTISAAIPSISVASEGDYPAFDRQWQFLLSSPRTQSLEGRFWSCLYSTKYWKVLTQRSWWRSFWALSRLAVSLL